MTIRIAPIIGKNSEIEHYSYRIELHRKSNVNTEHSDLLNILVRCQGDVATILDFNGTNTEISLGFSNHDDAMYFKLSW